MSFARFSVTTCAVALFCSLPSGCNDGGATAQPGSSSGSEPGSSSSTGVPIGSTSSTTDLSSSGTTLVEGCSSTGEPGVYLGGKVQDFGSGGTPIPGAIISVLDSPDIEAVSDDEGAYSLGPLPPSEELFVTLAPNETYLGSIVPLATGTTDETNQPLTQISLATVNQQFSYIEGVTDQVPDLVDHGVIIVRLAQNTATGTTIAMEPAPVPGTFYAPNAAGMPVVDQSTVEFGLLPVVVYFNVPPTEVGGITVTATHPERTCTVLHPAFPILAGYITLVEVSCPA